VDDSNLSDELSHPHLIEYLYEVGPIGSTGMGPSSINWVELKAWADMAQVQMTGWEARTLRTLSRVYLDQYMKSEDKATPSPFEVSLGFTEEKNDNVANVFKAAAARKRSK